MSRLSLLFEVKAHRRARSLTPLVVLDANPLEDIRMVEKVFAVVLNGRYLDRDLLERAQILN
jgi:hypothetical protein